VLSVSYILEIIAVLSALGYVILASKQHVMCWPVSLVSCFIYGFLYFEAKLYMESILQLFYVAVSIYGWMKWKPTITPKEVTVGKLSSNIISSLGLIILSLILGQFISRYTNASLPFADSMVFIFSIFATYITAEKKIESWIYWIILDAACVFIYLNRGLNITATLFMLYTILAFYGYHQWKKESKKIEPSKLR